MRYGFLRCLTAALALATSTVLGHAADAQVSWLDTPTARLEAFALLEELNADLLGHDSATLTLDRWCAAHHLATPAKIVANQDRSITKAPDQAQRGELAVGPDEPVRYRRVRLSCGDHVLSEADNWYVPSRLTPEMNHVLDTSDTAFGRAVLGLHFQRHTQSAELLWRPVPDDWESGSSWRQSGNTSMPIPHAVIQHKAVLTLPDGTPFSEVVETYTNAVLDFPVAPLP